MSPETRAQAEKPIVAPGGPPPPYSSIDTDSTRAEFMAHELHERVEEPANHELRTALAVAELAVGATGEWAPATEVEEAEIPGGDFRKGEDGKVLSMSPATTQALVNKYKYMANTTRNNPDARLVAEAVGSNKYNEHVRNTRLAADTRRELGGR